MTTTSLATTTARDESDGPRDRPLRWFVGVPFRLQTYRNLLYLALAFPLGVTYFVAIVAGVSMGIGLVVTLIGVPLLLATIVAATILAGFEAQLATVLLGTDAPLPEALRSEHPASLSGGDGGLVDTVSALLTAPTTWTSLLLVLLKFGYGIAAFTALVTATTLVTALLLAPFVYADPAVHYTVGSVAIDTPPEAVAAAGAGLLVGLVSLHLLNGLAIVGGLLTARLLEVATEDESNGDDAVTANGGDAANADRDGDVDPNEDE
ncbi:sensor domain-containing protein [Halosolutus amylolyticus]|uniref:Sensor domain-containing protein n=1 Tax=Halosolutus amylolyticus TaxID=2932267 RepID=A0ABD5PLD5_9EURY|nr:sensor domain-containing protein [Halosolutus amylolyticus]